MTAIPPLLPQETLERVLRLARFDGLSVVVFAALYALTTAMAGNATPAVIGLLAAGAGALELHGVSLLRHGEPRGITWLIGSQPFLWCVVAAYCAFRWTHFEMPPVPDTMRPMIALSAEQWGMSVEQYFRFVNQITCIALLLVSLAYQGGLMIYYFRRRHAIARALGEE
jgi:hypothetical protein